MKYSIISINDKRAGYKENIRRNMDCPELKSASIDGLTADLKGLTKLYGLKNTDWQPSYGEMGIWLSAFIRWYRVSQMNEPLVVFEDDAIIRTGFVAQAENIISQLPEDWDFVSLWIPENQRIDYRYNLKYDETGAPQIFGMRPDGMPSYFDYGAPDVAKVYQGYGMVATMYSPQGGNKLVKLARSRGIYTPVDCFLMLEAHRGKLNGYAPKPDNIFVDYDWPETQIHNTEIIK